MNDSEHKEKIHTDYRHLRNKIVALTKASKKLHYQKYFQENSKNIKKTWAGIKQIINIRQCNKSQPSAILIDNEINSDPESIANSFNNYFANVGSKMQEKINDSGTDFKSYLKNHSKYNFLIEPADCQEILLLINSFD